MSNRTVKVKWAKNVYNDVSVDMEESPMVFKAQLYALTGVVPERQKVVIQGMTLKDDNWNGINLKNNSTVLLLGSKEENTISEPETKPVFLEDLSEGECAAAYEMPGGITNLGNTCYVAATLQCLTALEEICDSIKTFSVSDQKQDRPFRLTLLAAVKDALNIIKSGSVFIPVVVLEFLSMVYPHLAEKAPANQGFKQQDANEFLVELLNCSAQFLPAIKSEIPQNNSFKSIVNQYLGGKLSVSLKCAEDDSEPIKHSSEEFIQLSCFITQDVKFMMSGLKNKMEEKISKRSDNLQRDATYIKKCQIDRLPSYLLVQFVRFCFKGREAVSAKILKDIKFPFEFDAFELCTPDLQEKLTPMRRKFKEKDDAKVSNIEPDNKKSKKEKKFAPTHFENDLGSNNSGYYSLKAVLTHKGRSVSSGHYVGWVLQSNGVWVKCDDDIVTAVHEEDIAKLSGGGDWHTAYVLIYASKKLEID